MLDHRVGSLTCLLLPLADRYLLFVHGTQAEADAARAMLKPLDVAA